MTLNREALIAKAVLRDPIEPLSRREWWRGAALYEVYVRSFRDTNGDGIGDLPGVQEKLDYIASLHVDGVWLSPIYPSPMKDFGYDITDFTSIDSRLGTVDDLEDLLSAAHDRGLKLLLDFTAGHTSDEHPWFAESRQDRENDRADWYIWADAAEDGGPPNNWLSSFGGSAWAWEPSRAQYYYHPFLACQPALNLRNADVMAAVGEAMRFWLDLGIDGFRLDAVQCLACDPDLRSNPPAPSRGTGVRVGGGPNNPFGRQQHLHDRDVPEALEILAGLRDVAEGYTPERVLIGELADVDSSRLSEKYTADGLGFHAVYDFDLINRPATVEALAERLRDRSAFLRTGWLMNVFSNHDSTRGVSNLTGFAVEAGLRAEAAKMLFFLQFCLKGGGILYQGEELGLPHPKLKYEELMDPWGLTFWPDFEGRDGARTPMVWRADGHEAGFTDEGTPWFRVEEAHKPLAVDAQEDDPDSVLAFLRAFLAWRRDQPLLIWGGERTQTAESAPVIVWDRWGEGETLTCAVNFSLESNTLDRRRIEDAEPLAGPGCATRMTDASLPLPPLGFAVLARAGEPDKEVTW